MKEKFGVGRMKTNICDSSLFFFIAAQFRLRKLVSFCPFFLLAELLVLSEKRKKENMLVPTHPSLTLHAVFKERHVADGGIFQSAASFFFWPDTPCFSSSFFLFDDLAVAENVGVATFRNQNLFWSKIK